MSRVFLNKRTKKKKNNNNNKRYLKRLEEIEFKNSVQD